QVTTTRPTDSRPAPESEKAADLYPRVLADFERKHPGALKYRKLDLLTSEQIQAQTIAQASAPLSSNQQISVAEAAFQVPGAGKADETTGKFFRGLYETAPEPF